MNKYLLSIDPSMANSGFVLWKGKIVIETNPNNPFGMDRDKDLTIAFWKWKPIWVGSYNFKKWNWFSWCDLKSNYFSINNGGLHEIDLIIERGIHVSYFDKKKDKMVSMGRGKETLDHLRGFIAGQFNKLLDKDMLVSSSTWRKWYLDKLHPEEKKLILENNKWTKKTSLMVANHNIKFYNWDITISNHDEAEALLIGWWKVNNG